MRMAVMSSDKYLVLILVYYVNICYFAKYQINS